MWRRRQLFQCINAAATMYMTLGYLYHMQGRGFFDSSLNTPREQWNPRALIQDGISQNCSTIGSLSHMRYRWRVSGESWGCCCQRCLKTKNNNNPRFKGNKSRDNLQTTTETAIDCRDEEIWLWIAQLLLWDQLEGKEEPVSWSGQQKKHPGHQRAHLGEEPHTLKGGLGSH